MLWKKTNWKTRKKWGGGGITAKNSSIPAENDGYPADFDKNCKNSQYLDNTKENFENAHITYNECTTKTTCAEEVGNIMSVDNKNKNENNKVSVSQFSHNENEKTSARFASVSCEQNRSEKKVAKCGYKTSEEICANDIKVNRDEQAEAKVQNSFTAKLCVCLFAIVACFAFALGFCFASLNGSSASNTFSVAADFGGGEGSASNPYLISSFADLNTLASNCNSGTAYENNYFKLTTDITISSTDLSSWTPIGCDTTGANSASRYFAGIFDGDNHTITFKGAVTQDIGQSSTSSPRVHWGLLFGYVKGNATDTADATNGIVKNISVVLDDNGTTTTDEFKITFNIVSSDQNVNTNSHFGGVVGYSDAGTVDSCNLSGSSLVISAVSTASVYGIIGGIAGSSSVVSNCTFNTSFTPQIGYDQAGIVASAKRVSGCRFYGDFTATQIRCGGLTASVNIVENCEVVGKISIEVNRSSPIYAGGAIGYLYKSDGVGYVKNCYVNLTSGSTINAKGSANVCVGLLAGYCAGEVENCYAVADIQEFALNKTIGSSDTYSVGLLIGRANETMTNCCVNAVIGEVSYNDFYFDFISASGNVNNCIVIADIGTLTVSSKYLFDTSVTAYNCVAITKVGNSGKTYSLSSSSAGTSATGMKYNKTKGLYSVAWNSSNTLVSELKQKSTYTSGTSNFTWNTSGGTSGGTAWSFATEYTSETGIWYIADDFNGGFPVPKQFYIPPIVNITINVTTNLGDSTTGSGTTGSMGSASEGGTAGAVNKFILYKLDSAGNIVNQYVVTNGSTIQFESGIGVAFTLKLIHKLYMVTTIDGDSVLEKTFTPSTDKTISISITAPANVNTWIVI